MTDFLSSNAVFLLVLSGVFFVGSLIAIPIVLVRLPPDYFLEGKPPHVWLQGRNPALRTAAYVLKNLAGLVFLLAGAAMLVLPGQGILTILIGISLMDFPGKRGLERKLIGQGPVLRGINKIREKFGRPPLAVR